MIPIIITLPTIYSNESHAIEALISEGVDIIHVRKPDCIEEKLRHVLNAVSDFSHLTLHYNVALALEYGFGGVHLRKDESLEGLRNSYSCHKWSETEGLNGADYTFLSPIFDSVSKRGYKAAFNLQELRIQLETRHQNVVALGGIMPENIPIVKDCGFDGVALIGSVWSTSGDKIDIKKTVNNYKKIVKAWE